MVQGLVPNQLCSGAPTGVRSKCPAATQPKTYSSSPKVFHTGLVIITVPVRQILRNVASFLREASQIVDQTLYIRLEPGYRCASHRQAFTAEEISHLRRIIPKIYEEASRECSHLDVRVLQSCLKNVDTRAMPLEKIVDVVICHRDFEHLGEYTTEQFAHIPDIHLLNLPAVIAEEEDSETVIDTVTFESVCLGGTFDRLHLGHKVLLSAALARAIDRLVVGVTDGDLIKSKVLWELIEPLEDRMCVLSRLLKDMDPTVNHEITPISDPYGPTIQDASLQCLYVSDETLKGGLKVNEARAKKNFPPMTLLNVSLLSDEKKQEKFMDDKISSSSKRISLLGKILREPAPHLSLPKFPLVIGLTGGVCTAKTCITETLESLGAVCISANLLGHEAYRPGTKLNQTLVDTFGIHIQAGDGSIDRKALGEIIFADAGKRDLLNALVWPEIEELLREKVEVAAKAGAKIVVIQAALLFEAGWDHLTHMVWYSLLSEKEAITRVMNRDRCDEELAIKKIHSQKPAKIFIDKAHIVLSSTWDKRVTQDQVRRAFQAVQKYIE